MKRFFSTLVLICMGGCSRELQVAEEKVFQTPEGEYTLTTFTPDPNEKLGETEVVQGEALRNLEELSALGPAFIAAYLGPVESPDLKVYDRAFRAWQVSESPQHSPQEVVEILGGQLGNRCVAELDMEWVLVTDQYGSDYAVSGRKKRAMGFPFSTVWKRIDAGEHDFLYAVFHALKQMQEEEGLDTKGSM